MTNTEQTKIKALLVEDNPGDAFLLQEKLADVPKIRFKLTHVKRLASAIEYLKQEFFDIILLDLSLPDSQGLETFLTLEKIVPSLPIILLTGLNDESLALEAVREGAQDYLIKERTTTDVLIRSVNYAIERMRHLEKIYQSEERLQKVNQELEERVQNRTFELESQNQELKKLFLLATTDKVTGIANRYRLEDFLEREWKNAIRNKLPLSVIMIDIDFFKLYNDIYGHLQGDLCLRKVAQVISTTLKRPQDLVARYGGEEFIAVLSNTTLEGARVVAENIHSQVKALDIPHITPEISRLEGYKEHNPLSISLGVASTIPLIGSQAKSLIQAADRALYQGKQKGRNRIEIYLN